MNTYSDEDFKIIVENSYSYKDCLRKIGYNSCSGDSMLQLKQKIKNLNIDISHFHSKPARKITREEVFVSNGLCSSSTVRRWFLKEPVEYKCSICGQEPFWNGKEMTLIMDHINGINNDHRLENLRWVCPNCNQQLETTNGKNIQRKNYDVTLCENCGKQISKGSKLCKKCLDAKRKIDANKKRSETTITKQELKQLIRTTSFTKIGEKFNVSDNAIKKWCKLYGLPANAYEINSFSDEEWCLLDNEFFMYSLSHKTNKNIYIFISTVGNMNKLFTEDTERFIGIIRNSKFKKDILQHKAQSFEIKLINQFDNFQECVINEKEMIKKLLDEQFNVFARIPEHIEVDSNTIIEQYIKSGTIKAVSQNTGYSESVIKTILKNNKISIKSSSEFSKENFGKAVVMKSDDNKELKIFSTTRDAARFLIGSGKTKSLNAATGTIADVCKGRQLTAYGYKWEYVNNDSNIHTTPHPNQYILCIETGIIYNTFQEASHSTGINFEGISSCCRGLQKTAGDLHWTFINTNDYTNEKIKELQSQIRKLPNCNNPRIKKVKCIETGITYESIASASNKTDINKKSISQVCLGQRKTAGGFHWEYATPEKEDTHNV